VARPKKNHGPTIYWRNGRAYADLRAYQDVGGGREALAPRGGTVSSHRAEQAVAVKCEPR
jgi:hypothetical protein